MAEIDWTVVLLTLLDVAAAVAVVLHILRHKREPVAAALWIFAVVSFPFLGLLLYLVFGINLGDRRTLKRVRKALAIRQECRRGQWRAEIDAAFRAGERFHGIARTHALLASLGQRPVVLGNQVELLVGGAETYRTLFAAIRAARSSIHLQTYILAEDEFGAELAELLLERRAAGVEVRVLYDAVGSLALGDRYLDRLERGGVRTASFGALNPIKRGFQINLRNHRKNAVIDGKVGFAGGINLHAENSRRFCRQPGACRERLVHDYHFRLAGPVVSQLQEVFAEDWYAMTGELVTDRRYFPAPEFEDETVARVITSGPGEEERVIARCFFAAIAGAHESVTLVTPYFYPDAAILAALTTAARSGVAVTLILPQRSDHRVVSWAGQSLYPELLAAGVKIFLRPLPFIHSKAMVIDRTWALVGSANLDHRSLNLNFELGLELIGDEIVGRLLAQLQDEIGRARPLTAADVQRWHPARTLRNNLCALFAPVL